MPIYVKIKGQKKEENDHMENVKKIKRKLKMDKMSKLKMDYNKFGSTFKEREFISLILRKFNNKFGINVKSMCKCISVHVCEAVLCVRIVACFQGTIEGHLLDWD